MDLIKFIEENGIEFIDLKYVDLIGNLYHLTLTKEKFLKIKEKGIGFDGSSVFGFSLKEGSDLLLLPDTEDFFIDPIYERKTLSFFSNIFLKKEPFPKDPRQILKKTVDFFKKEVNVDSILFRTELEFYLLEEADFNFNKLNGYYHFSSEEKKERNVKLPYEKSYHQTPPFDRYYELRQEIVICAKEIGIDIKYHHHENGQFGQEEIETEFYSPLKLSDIILILKYLIRNLAKKNNKIVTFLPKLFYQEAGNGLHFHFQILKENRNLLINENGELSEEGRYFINGIFTHLKTLAAFSNPSSNSYRRLASGFEAPQILAIGIGTRRTVFRIPGYLEEKEKTIEFRLPDALSNPYLLISAFLLAGFDGIKKKMVTPQNYSLPKNLEESLNSLEEDNQFLLINDIFNQEIIEEWLRLKKEELKLIKEFPHPVEYLLYFNL
jgi:glutamine synthetase